MMDEKWFGFVSGVIVGVFLTIVWWDTVKEWWFWRKTPYQWRCPKCAKTGKFRCGSRDVGVLDAMVRQHKERAHG